MGECGGNRRIDIWLREIDRMENEANKKRIKVKKTGKGKEKAYRGK